MSGPQRTGDVQALPLNSQLVTAIQGRPVVSTQPSVGQSYVWNGSAWVPGGRIVSIQNAGSVSTAGTTFGAGVDIFGSAMAFIADGTSTYIIHVCSNSWTNNTNTTTNFLRVNLDGADAGFITETGFTTAGFNLPCSGDFPITPAAGKHTVNLRLTVNGGTGTINGGSGGASSAGPILAWIEKL